MPDYLGDFQRGTTFSTLVDLFASGVATSLVGATLSAYKNASDVQTTTGLTLPDTTHDALAGLHLVSVDLSADATFFSPQSEISVVVTAGTLDGVSQVGRVLFSFSIENRHVAGVLLRTTIATLSTQTSFTLTAGSADNSAYVGATIVISDAASAVQKAIAVVSAYTGLTRTVTLLADPAIFVMQGGDYVTILANPALKATVPTRTLDVSATGEAGLDWANVGSPTTTVALSGTTVGVVTLLNGLASGVITAAAIATGAITNAKFAASAIDATAIASGAVTAAKFAASAIDATAIATGALTAAKFAAGAFDAVWTVTTRTLSAAGVQAIWDALTSALTTVGSIGKLAVDNLVAIKAKTDNLPVAPAAAGSAMTLTSGERNSIADARLDLSNGVETSVTVRTLYRALGAALAGQITGAGTSTEVFRAIGNAGTTRITITADASGNRTNVTLS